jgi:hypothetical protein
MNQVADNGSTVGTTSARSFFSTSPRLEKILIHNFKIEENEVSKFNFSDCRVVPRGLWRAKRGGR